MQSNRKPDQRAEASLDADKADVTRSQSSTKAPYVSAPLCVVISDPEIMTKVEFTHSLQSAQRNLDGMLPLLTRLCSLAHPLRSPIRI